MSKLAFAALLSLLMAAAPVLAEEASAAAPKKHLVKKGKRAPVRVAAAEAKEKMVKRVVMQHGRRKVVYQRMIAAAPALPTMGDLAGLNQTRDPLDLKSNVAFVLDQDNAQVLFENKCRSGPADRLDHQTDDGPGGDGSQPGHGGSVDGERRGRRSRKVQQARA